MLRFDIAAPLLGFSAPGALAAMLAAIALAAARPTPWLLETLSGRRTGAVVTRWLLPAAFVVPLAVGWTRLLAEREGLFGEAFGMALFTTLMIVAFGALILWVAHTLDHLERQRAQAEEQAGESREWLQVTLAAIGDGVIATDARRPRALPQRRGAAPDRLARGRGRRPADRRAAAALRRAQRRGAGQSAQRQPEDAQPRPPPPASRRCARATARCTRCTSTPRRSSTPTTRIAGAVLVLREAAAQRQAERAMREAYTELDERVVRRTAALERASAALRERNALLNAITTSTPDLIFAKDRDGRMLMGNPAWMQGGGRSREPRPRASTTTSAWSSRRARP